MSPNPPITLFTKLNLLEYPKEFRNQRFFMDKKQSPPSKVPKKHLLNPPAYLTHKLILKLRDDEEPLKPNLKKSYISKDLPVRRSELILASLQTSPQTN